jgi:sodium-dependent dicarboxylate transporter 2/3/5
MQVGMTEEKGAQRRYLIGLTVAFATFLLLLLLPLELPPSQHRLLAVLGFTFTCWVTEALPLPVTALSAMLLCVVLGILPAKQGDENIGLD